MYLKIYRSFKIMYFHTKKERNFECVCIKFLEVIYMTRKRKPGFFKVKPRGTSINVVLVKGDRKHIPEPLMEHEGEV